MITTIAVIAALAAGQADEPVHSPPAASAPEVKKVEPKAPAPKPVARTAEEALPEKFRLVEPGSPILRWGTPSRCLDRGAGYYRAQCDEKTKRCLAAPDAELDPDAVPTSALERAPACDGPVLTLVDVSSRGYAVVPALAEVPPGWYRDERQRVMQVDFDLNARYWLGGGGVASHGGPWSGGAVVAAGGRADKPFTWWEAPALARTRFLEGWMTTDGAQGEFLALGLDASRVYPTPLLRITTFFGTPRRFDPPLYFGLWGEALRFEGIKTETGKSYERLMTVAGAITVDLWRSHDLSDFLRLRGGAGYEQSKGSKWFSTVPHAAVEGEVTLGERGFHHLRFLAEAEWLVSGGDALPAALPQTRRRLTGKAEWEWIVFAINNQPLSVAVAAKAVKRDDVPDYPTGWVSQAEAQLRFSLFAPPRREAKVQGSLE
jgi:hypothetical protein